MKINRVEFLKALQLVSKAISTRVTNPLLSMILFEYDGSGIVKLTSTNYELSIQTSVVGKGKDAFSVAMPAKLITDFTNLSKSDVIDISYNAKDGGVVIENPTSKNKIKCMTCDEFPRIPVVKAKYIEISSNEFSNAVDQVSFAASIDISRPVLNGVLVTVDNGELVFCAADGYCLANSKIRIDSKYKDFPLEAVISSPFLNIISKSFDADGVLHIASSDNQVRFECENTIVVVQKISGQFPDYKMLLTGKKPVTTVTISAEELLLACRQIELFSSDSGRCVIEVSDCLKLSASSDDHGDSTVTIPCAVKGDAMLVSLNIPMMRDFLNICSSDNAVIEFINSTTFVNFKMEDVESYYCIIMPMALPESG